MRIRKYIITYILYNRPDKSATYHDEVMLAYDAADLLIQFEIKILNQGYDINNKNPISNYSVTIQKLSPDKEPV